MRFAHLDAPRLRHVAPLSKVLGGQMLMQRPIGIYLTSSMLLAWLSLAAIILTMDFPEGVTVAISNPIFLGTVISTLLALLLGGFVQTLRLKKTGIYFVSAIAVMQLVLFALGLRVYAPFLGFGLFISCTLAAIYLLKLNKNGVLA
jgi:hypothetical protein